MVRGRWLVWLALCCAASPALGQQVKDTTRAAARNIGNAGVEAYEAGNYAVASEKLEKAYSAMHAPSLGLWSARALVKLGKLVEAAERYLEVTRLPITGGDEAVQKKAQAEAASELEAITPKIPSLVIKLEGASASEVEVTLDGEPVPRALIGESQPVNPGRHKLEGRRGAERRQLELTAAEGEQTALLKFGAAKAPSSNPALPAQALPAKPSSAAPAPAAQPVPAPLPQAAPKVQFDVSASKPTSRLRTLGWVSLVAGAGAIVAGGVTGWIALEWHEEIQKDPELAQDVDNRRRFSTFATVSIVGLVSGGVLATTGIILVATHPKADKPSVALTLEIAPSQLSVSGAF